MDSAWGNNGLTSVNCGGAGVWGNSASSLSRGSIWNASGSGKRSSGDSWSSLEADSKLDNSGWGGLTSDGSSYRGRNGSPNSNVGASAGPDSDADPWGQSSGHGSSSSWGSASTSDNKDASGWGSLDPSPVPNAGTESWGFRPSGAGSGSTENRSNEWKQSGDVKTCLNLPEKDSASSFLLPDDSGRSASGEPKRGGQSQFQSEMSSLWSNCGSVSGPSHGQDAGSSETNPTDATQKSQQQQQQQQLEASAAANRGISPAGSQEMAVEPLTRDEIIRRAVNSNEGWGKTPIRQDTAWNIDEEPKKPFPLVKADEISADRNRPAVARDRSGSVSWNQPAEMPALSADKARTGSAVWSSVVSENSGLGMILKEMRGDLAGGPELGGKARLTPDKLPEAGWPARPVSKDVDWGSNLTLTDGSSWDGGKKDGSWDGAESIGKVGSGQTLTRSASASTWSSDEGDSRGWSKGDSKGPMAEKGLTSWANEQTEAQNWKPGYKSSTSVPPPTESLFNVPPPQFGGDGFGGLVGPWGNAVKQPKVMDGWGDVPQWSMGAADQQRSRAPSATDWNAPDAGRRGLSVGNMGDIGKPPQMRAHLLQRLMDMGFKKEDAQAALISNNLNMESAISKLLANQMRGVGLESDPDPSGSRRLFQGGANHVNMSMLNGRGGDLPPDVAACLVNLLQNTPSASAGSVPLGSHLGGAVAATAQLRSPPGGSVPPFTPNHLEMLSSLSPGLLPALQQKLVQPGLRSDGNQAAQVSALQQALLQNVQGAIQANLIPPHLITAQSLTPTVLIKLQQMMEMYQALQGLSARYQLMLQDNIVLVQSRQRPQNLGEIEAIMASFKQQIYQTQQQVLQELTVLQPPPLPSAAGVDQLLKNFASLQAKDDAFAGQTSLMNQWKVSSSGDDSASGILGHPSASASNPTLQQQHSISMPASQAAVDAASSSFSLNSHWMPSMTSCWTRAGSVPNDLASAGRSDDGAPVSMPFTSAAASTDGTATSAAENAAASAVSVLEDGTVAPQLEIAEFIPGIPWQGLSGKSAEDDPHLTLGSIVQGSLVLNNDMQGGGGGKLASSFSSSSLVGSMPDPSQGSGFTGISKSLISNANLSAKVSPWSPVDSSVTSDPWARNHGIPSAMSSYQNKMSYQQQQQQQQQQPQAPNRNISWSSGDRNAYKSLPPSSPCLPSNWLRLKNIAPQVDNRMLQALCEQHGALECFVPNLTREYVIVKYIKLDDACKAQRSLHACPIAGQSLVAEYLNKYEVFQILQQAPTGGVPPTQASKPFGASASSPYQFQGIGKAANPDRWNLTSGAPFGGGAGLGGGANPWSMSSDEHGLYLPNSKHL